jgi:hypothetical protein
VKVGFSPVALPLTFLLCDEIFTGSDVAFTGCMMRKSVKGGRLISAAGKIGGVAMALVSAFVCGNARADQNVTLAWAASTDTNVIGYYVYFGTNAGNLSSRLDVGMTTMATITGLTGRSQNYYFTATSYNSSRMESLPSSQALFTTSSNYGPSLASLPSVAGNVNALLVVTNTVTDPDGPSHTLTYSLAAGSPTTMLINSNSGRVFWRPRMTDGGTTNQVNVVVTDASTGLYSTQSFNVAVSNAVQVTLSNCVVALGNSGVIPVTVYSSTPLKSLSFVLDAPSNRVSSVTVSSLISGIATITQSPVGAAHSTITITALTGQTLQGSEQVANINFVATTGLSSAFSVGSLSTVTPASSSGVSVPGRFTQNSQLVLVGTEPLAQAGVQSNGLPSLTLYGPSGNSFQIQSCANPLANTGWNAVLTSGTLGTNLTQVFTNIPSSSGPAYYRILKL